MSKCVEFFFDLSSPYSYLAATQIESVVAETGAQLAWRPFVLGAVFKATGNDMPARVPAKAKYMLTDLERWAKRYGVPFRFSSHFPVNAIKAMRLAIVADRAGQGGLFIRAAFFAMWADDRDLADEGVLRDLAAQFGLDLAAIEDPAIKAALKENTDDAIRRGSFGAPSIFVGDQFFLGNDRLDFVRAALHSLP